MNKEANPLMKILGFMFAGLLLVAFNSKGALINNMKLDPIPTDTPTLTPSITPSPTPTMTPSPTLTPTFTPNYCPTPMGAKYVQVTSVTWSMAGSGAHSESYSMSSPLDTDATSIEIYVDLSTTGTGTNCPNCSVTESSYKFTFYNPQPGAIYADLVCTDCSVGDNGYFRYGSTSSATYPSWDRKLLCTSGAGSSCTVSNFMLGVRSGRTTSQMGIAHYKLTIWVAPTGATPTAGAPTPWVCATSTPSPTATFTPTPTPTNTATFTPSPTDTPIPYTYSYMGSGYFPTNYLSFCNAGAYGQESHNAASRWSADTDINMFDNCTDIQINVLYMDFGITNWAGKAYICNTSGQCENDEAYNSTYSYCQVWLNSSVIAGNPFYTDDEVQKLIMHELGHCYSLGHSTDPSSVMGNGSVPNAQDIFMINVRY